MLKGVIAHIGINLVTWIVQLWSVCQVCKTSATEWRFDKSLDPGCMQRCAAQHFPCFDYTYENPNAVTFEMVRGLLESLWLIMILIGRSCEVAPCGQCIRYGSEHYATRSWCRLLTRSIDTLWRVIDYLCLDENVVMAEGLLKTIRFRFALKWISAMPWINFEEIRGLISRAQISACILSRLIHSPARYDIFTIRLC